MTSIDIPAPLPTPKDPAPSPAVPSPEEIVKQLRLLRGQIPEFAPLTQREKDAVARTANVAANFKQASINGIGASAALQVTLGVTSEELQQETELAARWSAVADELKTLLAGVSAFVRMRHHRVGLASFQAYAISKQLIRQKEHAALIPHVAEMKRTKPAPRRRVKVVRPVPPPVVTTAPSPSTTAPPPIAAATKT